MSLAERLAERPTRGHYCSIGILLATEAVKGNDFDALIAAMQDRRWSSSELVRQLAAEGYEVSEKHMRPHRAGRCTTGSCPEPHTGVVK